MGLSTSASYHHVHLPDDLTQLHHSEAVHAAWRHTEMFSLKRSKHGEINVTVINRLCATTARVMHNTETELSVSDSPRLQGADGVDLCDTHNGSEGLQSRAAAFPHLHTPQDRATVGNRNL